jgi:uncharacterized protein YlxP (DUF503 family)
MCPIGLLTLHLEFPGCTSLKEKRSHIKPILARLHREFNVSAAEVGLQNHHRETKIAVAVVTNDPVFAQQCLQKVVGFIEQQWPDTPILDQKIEII